ncbi:hypothetical protein SGPA1_31070 [Streptomyces misionensis JCM 4497]
MVGDGWADLRGGGVDADRRAHRQLRPPGRAAPGVQLPVPVDRLGRRRAARGHRRHAGGDAPGRRPGHLGAVQPRRHPARHPLRQPAGARHPDPHGRRPRPRAAPGPRRHPADAGAARLGLPLPGRGTGPAGRGRPARRGAPGPRVLPRRGPGRLPRRLPGADPVDPHRAVVRLRRRRQLAPAAGGLGRAERGRADRAARLHPGAVPHRARRAPGAAGPRRRGRGGVAARPRGRTRLPPGRVRVRHQHHGGVGDDPGVRPGAARQRRGGPGRRRGEDARRHHRLVDHGGLTAV